MKRGLFFGLLLIGFFASCSKEDKQDILDSKRVSFVFSPGGSPSTFGYINKTSGDKGNRSANTLTTINSVVRPGDNVTLQMTCDRTSSFNQEIRIVMDDKELSKSSSPQYSDGRQTVYVLKYTFNESLFKK